MTASRSQLVVKLCFRPRVVTLIALPIKLFRFNIVMSGDFLKWPSVGRCHCVVLISNAVCPGDRGISERGSVPVLSH